MAKQAGKYDPMLKKISYAMLVECMDRAKYNVLKSHEELIVECWESLGKTARRSKDED